MLRFALLLATTAALQEAPIMPKPCCSVLELRQYTLHPGKREALIDLFEREFVETQEAAGMRLVGQFRDLDGPDRFVWLRGFDDMDARRAALQTFYGGPVWKAHREAANATMIDSDNVLLLRPVAAQWAFAASSHTRPPAGAAGGPAKLVIAEVYSLSAPVDDSFRRFFHDELAPALAEAGTPPLAALETEPSENTFPRLPVRKGENVFVWFASVASAEELPQLEARLARSHRWTRAVAPELARRLSRAPERLRLAPTARSLLR
jgi:quinol monooxygenase YgiN